MFAEPILQRLVGPEVRLIETGAPVARQTRRLLAQAGRLAPGDGAAACELLSTGEPRRLHAAAARWLGWPGVAVQALQIANLPSEAAITGA